jgi:hypothetical protein
MDAPSTSDEKTWFRYIDAAPSVIDAIDHAEKAGRLRDLVAYAAGYIGQQLRTEDILREAQSAANHLAAGEF